MTQRADNGRKKRVIFFADPPYYGGAEESIVMLATACPRERWEPFALAPADEGGEELARRLQELDVEVHRFHRRPWQHPGLAVELRGFFRRIRPDVLHMNLPSVYDSCLSVPAVVAKLAGCPRVVTNEHLPMVDRARRRMVVKMALAPWIDAMIVQTQSNLRFLVDKHHMPEHKVRIIPNASAESPHMSVDEGAAFRAGLGIRDGEVALVVAASLHDRKGHRFLLEALSRLPESLSSWRLILAGEGDQEALLRAQAEKLSLTEKVNFLGFRSDAREVIHSCDLMVLPSIVETQPFSIIEAMASGLPVISSSIFGIPEIVVEGETGRLLEPRDVDGLRGALTELLRDETLRRRMGQAGRARYEKEFTLELMASRFFEVFEG